MDYAINLLEDELMRRKESANKYSSLSLSELEKVKDIRSALCVLYTMQEAGELDE
jgi:hypothetical protein